MSQPLIAVRSKPIPPDFVPFERAALQRPLAWHFEQQARHRPDQLALQAGARQMSYGEANAAANRLAHFILHQQRGQSAPVAFMLPQGAAGLKVLLACLKAGKIYAGLDPALPQAPMRTLLQNSEATLLLCDRERLETALAAAGEGCAVVDVDTIDFGPVENPDVPLAPDDIAAITYTSGSTGQPKGVMHTHASILIQIYRHINFFAIAPSDRLTWLRLPSILALLDTFVAWSAGASIFPLDLRTEPMSALARLMAAERITVSGMVATIFRQVCAHLTGSDNFPHLRYVTAGGETIHRSDIELFRRHFAPGSVLSPGWGVTEGGGSLSRQVYDHSTPLPDGALRGYVPFEDVQLLMLDPDGRPVASGESGEIAVRSAALPAGYWRQPELTHERFRPDPLGGAGRIYLTGDRGRLLPDGSLEHLGRIDYQLKVRGFRVEPAEIERILLATPGVRQTVVVVRHDPPAEEQLVAYIVPSTQPPPTVSELRKPLAVRLPDYMIPSAFVFMDALPRATSGKVNRSRLPAPDNRRPALSVDYVAPRTPVEQTLARLWSEVLRMDEIGSDDPFLELGGHSLQAAKIIARVLREFRVDLSLRALFDAPTINAMATLITTHQAQTLNAEKLEELLHTLEG